MKSGNPRDKKYDYIKKRAFIQIIFTQFGKNYV